MYYSTRAQNIHSLALSVFKVMFYCEVNGEIYMLVYPLKERPSRFA
jgi:hypothetical protein